MNKSKGTFNKNPSNWKARGFKSTNVVSETVASTFATGTNMIPVNRALSMKRKFKTTDTNSNEAPATNDTTVEKPALSIEKKLKTTDTNSNEAPVTNDAIVEKPAPTIPLKIKKKKSILKKKHNAPGKSANNQTGKSGGGEEKPAETNLVQKRKKQKTKNYVLFIGNLSYETTNQDLMDHFAKCGTIKSVRIPTGKEDNKPRGFAYLEVDEHKTYENVVSLHHSFLRRRRINVECTFGGSEKSAKRKAIIKEKTCKMRFLSREGKISSAKLKQWGKKKPEGTPKTIAES